MRNISFFITEAQIRDRTKTVTRRLGWKTLQPGTILNACRKCQGLRKGEKVEVICQIKVVSVRREWLSNVTTVDVRREGFPHMTRWDFMCMFLDAHKIPWGTDPEVTRIEFEYI